MRSRSHISFRREATFRAEAHQLALGILDREREAHVRREDLAPRVREVMLRLSVGAGEMVAWLG